MAPVWLRDAVFYEIYPQSFYDSNGDGIGDIPGIIQKLPYIKSLGCNALWLNPVFDSPFMDGGYDVRDYKKVAPRYGSNGDLAHLFEAAHGMGIRVLLDLVPGHTSQEHAWFLRSGEETPNELWDRYLWTDSAFAGGDGMPFIGGEHPRDAAYIVNFFKCQPALNYGYREIRASWQQPITAPGPMATREAMKDVMRYWLNMGCDGFRVDMADSLVKNDGCEKTATMEVWRDIAGSIHAEYPNAALVSEWNRPCQALNCGFDMDFYLNWDGNGYASLMRGYTLDARHNVVADHSYFRADGGGDISRFLEDYLPQYEGSRGLGLWCFFTCNHDTKRATLTLDERERRLAYAFLFTMPGAPFLYYGDEIGMRYRFLPTKEGGYQRTGSRTPMQWDGGKNLGFSQGREEDLYLPVDPAADAATVESQEREPDSMLHFVRSLIALRHTHPDLQNYSPFKVCFAKSGCRLFAYKRGDYLLAVNPGRESREMAQDGCYAMVYAIGDVSLSGGKLVMGGQSFVVLRPTV